MAAKKQVRLDCRAVPYLEPAAWPEGVLDPAATFLAEQSRTPVRVALEAKSDLTFISDLAQELRLSGLSDEAARAATFQVLSRPTVAASRSGDGGDEVLQSVLLERGSEEVETQITAQFRMVAGKPASAKLIDVEANYLDLTHIVDQLEAVRAVEAWRQNYPSPNQLFPEPYPIPPWGWVGDASQFPLSAPAGWQRAVSLLGEVYGVSGLIADSPGKLRTHDLERRVSLAFVLRGSKWAVGFPSMDRQHELEVVFLGADPTCTFENALSEARATLFAYAWADRVSPKEPRELAAGEIVYHRKVGQSSRKFDHFDEGSAKPCSHGVESFGPWGGDKARKGMARRYTNFNPKMLIHCGKFPDCGMYGVDAGRGGLR